jgi:probable F420-dependent oxidoreductase
MMESAVTTLPHHPFRFACGSKTPTSGADFVAYVRKVEDLGYSTIGFADHFIAFPTPLAGMAVAAAVTSHLRVAAIFANDFWHPAWLAREILAIDLFSNGRLEFNIGSGWYKEDYAKSGIPLEAPGVRISRLEESVHILKGLLSGETVTFQGKYYMIDQLSLEPKPVQKPHPPILIGGGSKRILSLAARQADIISFNIRTTPDGWLDTSSVSLEATRQKVEWVCQAAGERLPDLEFSIVQPGAVITRDREQAARQIIENYQQWGLEYTMEDVLNSPAFLVGDVEQIVDQLQQNREQFGFSYYGFGGDELDSWTPVVKRLAGT